MRCAGQRLQGCRHFQKIRDTRRPEGVRRSSELGSDKKSTNARKTSYSTDVGVLPSVRENLSVLPFRHVPIGARVQAHWSLGWLCMNGFPERWIIILPRCLPAERFPTFASGRQGRGPVTLLDFHRHDSRPLRRDVKTPSKDQLTAQLQSPLKGQSSSNQIMKNGIRRRSFLKGLGVTGAALLPAGALLVNKANAHAAGNDDSGGS